MKKEEQLTRRYQLDRQLIEEQFDDVLLQKRAAKTEVENITFQSQQCCQMLLEETGVQIPSHRIVEELQDEIDCRYKEKYQQIERTLAEREQQYLMERRRIEMATER